MSDHSPLASFSAPVFRPGVPSAFDASASSDPDGAIARYDWTFGDGGSAAGGDAMTRHAYRKAGDYKVTLPLTDDEGFSTALIFSGQTASAAACRPRRRRRRSRSPTPASASAALDGRGPAGAGSKARGGEQARRGTVESAVTRATVPEQSSAIVSVSRRGRSPRSPPSCSGKAIHGSRRTRYAVLRIVR
ncbi:MAG: PKD domain-containing protein [Solirubrobacterales bacterium]